MQQFLIKVILTWKLNFIRLFKENINLSGPSPSWKNAFSKMRESGLGIGRKIPLHQNIIFYLIYINWLNAINIQLNIWLSNILARSDFFMIFLKECWNAIFLLIRRKLPLKTSSIPKWTNQKLWGHFFLYLIGSNIGIFLNESAKKVFRNVF